MRNIYYTQFAMNQLGQLYGGHGIAGMVDIKAAEVQRLNTLAALRNREFAEAHEATLRGDSRVPKEPDSTAYMAEMARLHDLYPI